MPERIQKLLDRIKEWWQKFTSRQKAIMISAAAVVVVALIILGVVLTRPEYLILRVANDAKEAQSIQELLQSNPDITWEQSDDGMTFRVLKKDYGTASILLGTNNISTDGYTINDALNGSFSTTEADTQKKYQLYLEKKYEDVLKSLENVSNADVNLYIPNDDGTIIANQQESSASVKLDLAIPVSLLHDVHMTFLPFNNSVFVFVQQFQNDYDIVRVQQGFAKVFLLYFFQCDFQQSPRIHPLKNLHDIPCFGWRGWRVPASSC